MIFVGAGVERLDKRVVLVFRGLDSKGVNGPVVRGADQLDPIS